MLFRLFFIILILVNLPAQAQAPSGPAPGFKSYQTSQPAPGTVANNAQNPASALPPAHAFDPRQPVGGLENTAAAQQPVIPPQQNTQPSRIETYYSRRIAEELEQFGYNTFASEAAGAPQELPTGGVPQDFTLSINDRVSVTMRGQINRQDTYMINNEGLLIVEELPPVPAAGRTLDELRNALEAVSASMPNLDIYVSLDKVRQINVLVIGDVKTPGRQNLTVFNTVLDALAAAGGIKKSGSLRQIELIRDGRRHIIDLYGLLLYGSDRMDRALQSGDRLVVPALGPTVAVSGAVQRPAIYEIRSNGSDAGINPRDHSEALSLQEMLDLAGGVLAPGDNRFVKMSLSPQSDDRIIEVTNPYVPQFTAGSVLTVSATRERKAGQIELKGHTRQEGLHTLNLNSMLSDLLAKSNALGSDIYPLLGVIERTNPQTLSREHIVFPPNLVRKGEFDRRLQDGDVVHLFSTSDIRNMTGNYDVRGIDYRPDKVLKDVVTDQVVQVKGAVRIPGPYPIAEGATLNSLLAVAGGMTREANKHRIEVTSTAQGRTGSGIQRLDIDLTRRDAELIALNPGDTVRVNQRARQMDNETVLVRGQVMQPGEYNLKPGDTLLDLMQRAGGLTPEAYPEGAIFSRARERRAEEERFDREAQMLKRAMATAVQDDKDERPSDRQLTLATQLAEELEEAEAVGRITVEADPDRLRAAPELDILLESGDRIFIPQRPYTVRVRGEVLSPANLQFRSGKDSRDYIAEAGSYTHYADKDRTFVLYPDGSAQPLEVGAWNFKPVMIPPGATIIVPRDPEPFNFMDTAKDVSQILSNLAITGIAVDDLRDDN